MGRFTDNRRGGFSRGRSSGSRFGSGRGVFGRDSGRGGRDGRMPLEMHDAVCDKCGDECRVPFRPTGNKPVLCSDCYRESGQGRDSGRGRDRGQSSGGMSSAQLTQINAKLDKIIKALNIDSDEDEEEDLEEAEEQ